MAILSAAVVVVGLLCLADLLLTFGVIRRLREHTEQLSGFPWSRPSGKPAWPTGRSRSHLPRSASPGERLSGPAGLRVVAFFSAGCSACPERVAGVRRLPARESGRAGLSARRDH